MQNRFKQAREERRLSAVGLADMLGVHPTSVSNWENGRRQVTMENLLQMAEILNFSTDYLLGRGDIGILQTEIVDKASLRTLHGQPVWTASHGWTLVNIVKAALVANDLSLIPFDEIDEEIYLIPPALSNSLRGIGKPLALDSIAEHGRVWVEPVTADTGLGAELRGWYHMQNNGRMVENEYGQRFYLDTYGAKWLAFEGCF